MKKSGTRQGTLLYQHSPFKIFLIVPLGLFPICFKFNSLTQASYVKKQESEEYKSITYSAIKNKRHSTS